MLFADYNRIDLKIDIVDNSEKHITSLSKVLIDKTDLFVNLASPTEEDYYISIPSQKEFKDVCNEFWWVSTYVLKGVARNEPVYAKEMLESPVRKMFLKMISWYIGINSGFNINLGNSYRFLNQYLTTESWNKIKNTYPILEPNAIMTSLEIMMEMFNETAVLVAKKLDLPYNSDEAGKVMKYIDNRNPFRIRV